MYWPLKGLAEAFKRLSKGFLKAFKRLFKGILMAFASRLKGFVLVDSRAPRKADFEGAATGP